MVSKKVNEVYKLSFTTEGVFYLSLAVCFFLNKKLKFELCGRQQIVSQNNYPKQQLLISRMGESLFTFFASLAYVPLFLLELQNRLFWILKELHKISFVWKYEADMLNSFLKTWKFYKECMAH